MNKDYLPARVLQAINRVFVHGAQKHGDFSWRTSDRSVMHHYNKALGHLNKWKYEDDNDLESGENHLAHAASRLIIALDIIFNEEAENGPQRNQGEAEGVTQTSTVSEYIQKEVAAWKKATGRD